MSTSFNGTLDELGVVDPLANSTELFENGTYGAYNSETVAVESSIYASVGGFASDLGEFSNGKQFNAVYVASDGPILPSMEEMQSEEGSAIREWKRQNAIRLEEKEKREKELVSQIIDEAEEFKINFLNKRKVTCETNKSTNREREKIYVVGQEKFYAEADKGYWKAIAELIPNEVPASIEKKRGGKKDQDKKASVVVIQGPKPGRPTDLSRMRQILTKLKQNTPPHLQTSPPPAPPTNRISSTPTEPAAVAASSAPLVVA